MPARKTTTSETTTTTTATTTRTRKPKALPGKENGGIGKGGVVTRHGVTTTGYQRGCRCDLCKAAMREYDRAARERKATEAKKATVRTSKTAVNATKAATKAKATTTRRAAAK